MWSARRLRRFCRDQRIVQLRPRLLGSRVPHRGIASRCRDVNYDPLVLPTGVTGSDDPVLAARSAVYAVSFNRREQDIASGRASTAIGKTRVQATCQRRWNRRWQVTVLKNRVTEAETGSPQVKTIRGCGS